MRLETLRIHEFRGIQALDLDLRGRLNLVYAPNGTGKTSVCDAVEWLLAGEVHRLGNENKDPAVLRNKWAQERTTLVEATLRLSGGSVETVSRTLGGRVRWGSVERGEAASLAQLLGLKDSEANVHDLRARLLGGRFLTGDMLSVLLDADESERRKRVYADIFGTSSIKKRRDGLRQISGELQRKLTPLQARESEHEQRVKKLEAALAPLRDAQVQATASLRERAEASLRQAAQHLGLEEPLGPGGEALSATLRARLGAGQKQLAAQSELLSSLEARLPTLAAVRLDVEEQQARLAERLALVSSTKQRRLELRDKLAEADRERAPLRDAAKLAQSTVDTLEELASRVEKALAKVGSGADLGWQPEHWRARLRDLERERGRLRAMVEALRLLVGESESRALDAELLAEELEALEGWRARCLSPADAETLRSDLAQSEAAAQELDRQRRALAGPLDQLRHFGQLFAEHQENGGDCPLCGHAWPGAEALKSAVLRTLETVPAAVRQLGEQHQHLIAQSQGLAARLTVHDRAQAETTKREASTTARSTRLSRFLERLAAALREAGGQPGVETVSLDRARLRDIAHLRSTLAPWLRLLEGQVARASESASELTEPIEQAGTWVLLADEVERRWSTMDPQAAARERDEAQLFGWPAMLAGWLMEAHDAHEAVTARVRSLDELREEHSGALAALAVSLAQHEATVAELSRQVEESRRPLADALDTWNKLGGPGEPTQETLATRRVQQVEKEERYRDVAALLDEAEHLQQADARAQTLRDKERELAEARQEQKLLKEQANYFERWRGTADAAIKQLEQHEVNVKNAQTKELDRVISALYGRAQANRLFQKIEGKDIDGHFRWRAHADKPGEAGELTFSPEAHLSLGQRQDLALAISLARARSLGGTFVLDEPLAHLDDLNRVAMLDLFRLLVIEPESKVHFVVTTANERLVRHFREKFALVPSQGETPPLQIITLEGDAKRGVNADHKPVGLGLQFGSAAHGLLGEKR